MIRYLILLLMIGYIPLFAMPQALENLIDSSKIPRKDISLYIKEAGEPSLPLVSLNATQSRKPASVIKVLTTYAALLKLGPSYRWPTQFYIRGKLRQGTLYGDLIVKGFGDPTLRYEDLQEIVSRIKAKGIRRIEGDIVIDRRFFKVGNRNSAHFDENPYSPYNAMPDAMMFNERVSTICVTPNKQSVTKKYPDGSYVVKDQLKKVNKPCRGRYSWPYVKVDESKAVPEVLLKGKISKRCGRRNICRVVTKPYLSFYYGLKEVMRQEGIRVKGNMRLARVPSDARILFTHYSKPLEKIIAKTAKRSNNLYARHLLLLLGAKVYGTPATVEKGRRAILSILRSSGALVGDDPKIDNGSGLSRTSRLSAKSLALMLDHAYIRYGKVWMRTLSIAGVDGTIKKRFRGSVVQRRAWMKTGTLKRVKNIAGYVKSRSGRYYTVVILVNTKQGRWRAAKLQNDIIKWLVGYRPQKHMVPVVKKDHTDDLYYYIQAGSFLHPPKEKFLKRLADEKWPYEIRHETEYKVLIGPFKREEKARMALRNIREYLNKGAFLTKEP